jgi:hypothetical protein
LASKILFSCHANLLKGVEVGDHNVNGINLVALQLLHVGGVVALGQQAAVDGGMQRLDAAVLKGGMFESDSCC